MIKWCKMTFCILLGLIIFYALVAAVAVVYLLWFYEEPLHVGG